MSKHDCALSVKKQNGGQNKHIVTEEKINLVKSLARFGVKTELIANHLRISEPTLFKYYKDHMADSRVFAHMNMGESLYNRALNGDTSAAIFYAKTQMGWKEPKDDDTEKNNNNTTVIIKESDKSIIDQFLNK